MISTFMSSLAGGMLIVLALSRTDQIAPRFVRLAGIICLAVSSPVAIRGFTEPPIARGPWGTVAAVAISFAAVAAAGVVLITPLLPRAARAVRVIAACGGPAALVAAGVWTVLDRTHPEAPAVFLVIGRILGAFLLGSVTVAWLLGHAYLTATKMPIDPLRRLSRLFSLAVILRVAYAAIAVGGMAMGEGQGISVLTGAWLILALRAGVGLLAVGVFAYMVADCVKLRATQSATGILYFASVFVYIGELASQHLASQFSLPL